MAGFVDECALNVRGGDGGAGSVSFRREAHVPRGGPDGGDGGSGGDVWLVADRNVASLLAFRDHPHRRATDGSHGAGQGQARNGGEGHRRHGAARARRCERWRRAALLADLVNHGDRWLAAAGGRGGRGNARFLSNRRRAPSFAEQGSGARSAGCGSSCSSWPTLRSSASRTSGKSTLISPHLRGQAEDRRLPVHDPRAEPRRRAPRRRRSRSSSPTSPG